MDEKICKVDGRWTCYLDECRDDCYVKTIKAEKMEKKGKKPSRGIYWYTKYYWCKQCGWIPKEDTLKSINGKPLCPKCKRLVRTRPLKKK